MDVQSLFDLKGRVALVTGGSRGIGRMIAEGFLAQGARVYISARKADQVAQAVQEMASLGPCEGIVGNVATVEGCQALAAEVARRESARLGGGAAALHILVNNAGVAWGAPFADFPEGGWDKVVDTNLKGPFFLTQAVHGMLKAGAGQLKAQGAAAKVIHIASIDGISVNPWDTYSYSASKAGLIQLTRRMALELAPQNIVCSAIAPGPFGSEMNREARDHATEVAQRVPLGRVGMREDMAGAAVFLASRAGDYVVGSTLTVDGGVTHRRS
jgi:NAD(P)-dependent dehydrogenase (short-subunit alcohol dehydrogenase family)